MAAQRSCLSRQQNRFPLMTPISHTKTQSTDPLALYFGKVTHARLKPRIHRFSYNVFSLVIDLDDLDAANKCSPIFSVNRRNIVSFHEEDHGERDGGKLREHVNLLLNKANLPKPEKVLLWCNPRVFGYTFNPLSVYFCYDASDEVFALIYQVHNTFGQSHSYVAGVDGENLNSGSIRQSADKRFYVSPFLDMDLRYNFRISPPDEALKIRILENDQEGPILSATFSGQKKCPSFKNLLLGILKTAGLTWKITAGIHYEAMILWLKGISIRPRPAPPVASSKVERGQSVLQGE